MRLLVFSIVFLLLPNQSNAEDGRLLKAGDEYRVLWQSELQGYPVFAVVHEGGHAVGQPFQVELRVNCTGSEKPISELPVRDSFSTCDMDPNSVKINSQQTALAMKIKLANLGKYYDDLGEGFESPVIECQQKTTIQKLTLQRLCQEGLSHQAAHEEEHHH